MTKNTSATTPRPFPRSVLLAVIGLFFLAAISFLVNYKVFLTDGPSMEPTYTEGTYLLGRRLYSDPKPGDVVFIIKNGNVYMKRVCFVAGDDISQEGYAGYWGSNIVPEGYVYVLGDNTEHSLDSRNEEFGLVAISDIWGKPVSQRENKNNQ